ncbi:hypothetical protein CJ179_01795 [Rhodococcus sp. ACS1]|uniref:hypothetical protein n=1 Tax=Rhodococcus sp. ACS1 TaxID=2028570 RepID=UPI000BB15116|nr:hypothetical protein [Rhodococcus sp. ACS1]PBC52144.1 hypothetical protein CJ179_01795 [Rhodococcus sp. ACS1]
MRDKSSNGSVDWDIEDGGGSRKLGQPSLIDVSAIHRTARDAHAHALSELRELAAGNARMNPRARLGALPLTIRGPDPPQDQARQLGLGNTSEALGILTPQQPQPNTERSIAMISWTLTIAAEDGTITQTGAALDLRTAATELIDARASIIESAAAHRPVYPLTLDGDWLTSIATGDTPRRCTRPRPRPRPARRHRKRARRPRPRSRRELTGTTSRTRAGAGERGQVGSGVPAARPTHGRRTRAVSGRPRGHGDFVTR